MTRAELRAAFARHITRERHNRRWTLRQAAAAAGTSYGTIARAELGTVDIALSAAAQLAAAYGTTLDALLTGDPQ